MSSRRGLPPARLVLGLLLALVAGVAALRADRLVLRSGERLETRGPWSERGPLVVFTDERGALRSLRASEIDLEASRKATAAALAPVAPPAAAGTPAAPAREPILRLTEKELPPVADPEAHEASAEPPGEHEPRVVLYSTSWCGWCRRTRELFAALGIRYLDKDVEKDPAARREQLALTGGSDAVPVVDWDGQVIRGFAETTLRELARSASTVRAADPQEPASSEDG